MIIKRGGQYKTISPSEYGIWLSAGFVKVSDGNLGDKAEEILVPVLDEIPERVEKVEEIEIEKEPEKETEIVTETESEIKIEEEKVEEPEKVEVEEISNEGETEEPKPKSRRNKNK